MIGTKQLRLIALKALEGVGDETGGQWEEYTRQAFHLRRRLTVEEQERVGPALDIRGTEAAVNRVNAIRIVCPFLPVEMLFQEAYGGGG